MLESSCINRCKFLIHEIAVESAILDLESNIDVKIRENLDNDQKEY